jgi:hypothetical protein
LKYNFFNDLGNFKNNKNGTDTNPIVKYFIPYNPDIYTADKLTWPIELIKEFRDIKAPIKNISCNLIGFHEQYNINSALLQSGH